MAEYTPTTEQVRETYAALCKTEAAADEFSHWLAAHDAEIRETATREERWRCIALIRQKFGITNRAADWLDRLDREGAK